MNVCACAVSSRHGDRIVRDLAGPGKKFGLQMWLVEPYRVEAKSAMVRFGLWKELRDGAWGGRPRLAWGEHIPSRRPWLDERWKDELRRKGGGEKGTVADLVSGIEVEEEGKGPR